MTYPLDTLTKTIVVRDTVVSISPAEMVDMYKTLLETEQTNYTTYITILLGLVVVILGFAVYWNKVGSERMMKEQLDKLVAERVPGIIAAAEKSVQRQVAKDILNHDVIIYRSLAFTLQKPETYSYSSTWYAMALIAAVRADNGRQIRAIAEEIVKELTSLKERGVTRVYQLKPFREAIGILPTTVAKEKEQMEGLLNGVTGLVSDDVEI